GAPVVCLDKQPGLRMGVVGRLRRVLRELSPDVLHTHVITALFYAGPAAAWAGVPVVVHTEHGREDYHRRRRRWLGWLAGLFATRFYCLSEDLAEFVTSHGIVSRDKIQVIGNGIDLSRFSPRQDTVAVRQALEI